MTFNFFVKNSSYARILILLIQTLEIVFMGYIFPLMAALLWGANTIVTKMSAELSLQVK